MSEKTTSADPVLVMDEFKKLYNSLFDRGIFVERRGETWIQLPGQLNTGEPRIVPSFEPLPDGHPIERALNRTLAACPFNHPRRNGPRLLYMHGWCVQCWDCATLGPLHYDMYRAAGLWNDRRKG